MTQIYNGNLGWERAELPDLDADFTGFLCVFLRIALKVPVKHPTL
jgi:hypothetical protein